MVTFLAVVFRTHGKQARGNLGSTIIFSACFSTFYIVILLLLGSWLKSIFFNLVSGKASRDIEHVRRLTSNRTVVCRPTGKKLRGSC